MDDFICTSDNVEKVQIVVLRNIIFEKESQSLPGEG